MALRARRTTVHSPRPVPDRPGTIGEHRGEYSPAHGASRARARGAPGRLPSPHPLQSFLSLRLVAPRVERGSSARMWWMARVSSLRSAGSSAPEGTSVSMTNIGRAALRRSCPVREGDRLPLSCRVLARFARESGANGRDAGPEKRCSYRVRHAGHRRGGGARISRRNREDRRNETHAQATMALGEAHGEDTGPGGGCGGRSGGHRTIGLGRCEAHDARPPRRP